MAEHFSPVHLRPKLGDQLDCGVAASQLGGGMMVFDVQNTSQAYMKAVWPDATVAPGCLR